MRVMVTGGSGNIGQEVTRLLHELHHEVFVYDLVPSPDPLATFLEGDIRDAAHVARAFKDVRAEGIVHLAGTLQFACDIDPAGAAGVNVTGTVNVLEAAVQSGARRIVFSSSAAVYGATDAVVRESSPIQANVSSYGAGKLLAERMLRRYQARHGLICRSVRFSTVLSSRPVSSPGVAAAVCALLGAASRAEVTVKGVAGPELRHFIHVADAARGAVLALLIDRCEDDLFNIAGGDDSYLSFDDLVAIIKRIHPGFGKVIFVGVSGNRGRIDCSKATDQLGYRPEYGIEMAIREVMKNVN